MMRTTLDIDAELLRQQKHRAVSAGMSLSEYVGQVLRDALHEPAPPPDHHRYGVAAYGDPKRPVAHEPGDFAETLDESDAAVFR